MQRDGSRGPEMQEAVGAGMRWGAVRAARGAETRDLRLVAGRGIPVDAAVPSVKAALRVLGEPGTIRDNRRARGWLHSSQLRVSLTFF